MVIVGILMIEDADITVGADRVYVQGLGGDVFFKDFLILTEIFGFIMTIDSKQNIFDVFVEIGHFAVFFVADFAKLDVGELFRGVDGILLLSESVARIVEKLCAAGLCDTEAARL